MTNTIANWVNDFDRYFSKEDMLTTKKYTKRCLILLFFRQMKSTPQSYNIHGFGIDLTEQLGVKTDTHTENLG